MNDEDKSKEELIAELISLRRQLAEQESLNLADKSGEAAELSETKYRQLFESMTSGVVVYEAVAGGQDFVIKDFNRAAEQIEGIIRTDIIGRRVTEVFPGIREFGLLELLQKVWQTGAAEHQFDSFYQDERISGWRENYVYKLPSGEIVAIYNDITERKQAEEAVREREAKLRTLFEILPVGISILDDRRNLFDLNPAMERILGLSREELLAKKYTRRRYVRSDGTIMPPEEFPSVRAAVERRLVQNVEIGIVKEDGETIWTSVSVSPVSLPDWDVVVTTSDITARKQTEEAFSQATQLLETILEYTPILVAYLDPQFNFVRVNRAYAAADERGPSFYPGRNHFELYPHAENEAIFRRVVETGEPYFAYAKPFEYSTHPERGLTYWDWSLVPTKNWNGAVTGLVFTLVNVTERIQAEESLRREHNLLQQVMETSPVGITVTDRAGRITFANSRGEEILGLSRTEIAGLTYNAPVWQITDFEGNQFPDEQLPFRRVMATAQPVYDVRHAIKWPNGRQVLLSINAAPLTDRTGRLDGVVTAIEDVTARVRAEERRQKQLEQELRSLDLLSALPQTEVTAHMFGLTPLRENLPDIFQKLVEQYEAILDLAVEQRIYKVDHPLSDGLRRIAGRLGAFRAGPRDVVEIHSRAVSRKIDGAYSDRARLYVEEGRLVVLELMGYLTTHYRNQTIGANPLVSSSQEKRGAGYDE